MQRVVRTTLVGLLAIGGLTACGDKVTVPAATTPAPDNTVTLVTVTPGSANLNVGDKITLAASVTAGSGVSNRTVTWSTSNAAIATVDAATGSVTAVAAGTATIVAKSVADPTVQGAAVITVGSNGGVPVVTISSVNQTNGQGQSVPVDIAAAKGQLDVILNVEANGTTLKTINATIKCGNDVMTRSQTIGAGALAPAAEASTAPVTFSFNTAEFNGTTGTPTLHNGACTINASAVTTAGTQSAVNTTQITLANQDRVIVRTTTNGSTASDSLNQAWKSGAVTVAVTPVIYSTITPANYTITLPGAAGNVMQTVAATGTTTSATWSNTSTTGPNVTQLTLAGPADANHLRAAIQPTVLVIDNTGTALPLIDQVNSHTESDIRVDNQSPNAPTLAQFVAADAENWVMAGYTFTGAGKYVSGTDAGVDGDIFTVFVAPAASAPAPLATNVGGILTGTTAAACVTTGMTQVASSTELQNSYNNTAYVARIIESDKLGNIRCSDFSALGARLSFRVDKDIPVASIAAGPNNQAVARLAAALTNGGNFTLTKEDTLSGFTGTPFQVITTRLDATGAGNTAKTTCVVGSGTSCSAQAIAGAGPNSLDISSTGGSPLDGYYTTSIKVADKAGNVKDLGSRTILVDNTAPQTTGGVAIPANITANSTQSFSASFTDNLDLVRAEGSVVYGNMTISYAGSLNPTGATFDNVLTTAATATVSIPAVITDMQQVDGGNAPTAAGARPTNVNIRALDATGLSAQNSAVLPPANVADGSATEFGTANFATFQVTNAAANISNGTTGTPANPQSVALTATTTHTSNTAVNPFTQVCFYYQNTVATSSSFGEWVLIGCQSAAAVTDVPGTRTWKFTLSSFDPPAALGTAGALNIRAVGMNASGNAISSNTNSNITLTP